jgi:hypothetical protein
VARKIHDSVLPLMKNKQIAVNANKIHRGCNPS